MENNKEDFFNKCLNKMLSTYYSKPEKLLMEILSKRLDYNFKQNLFIIDDTFITKTKRKQIDIADNDRKVFVEFDGLLHFQDKLGNLDTNIQKDRLLDEYIIKNKCILIRVAYDQFSYRKSDYGFNQKCLDRINEILDNPEPNVYYIGAVYNKDS